MSEPNIATIEMLGDLYSDACTTVSCKGTGGNNHYNLPLASRELATELLKFKEMSPSEYQSITSMEFVQKIGDLLNRTQLCQILIDSRGGNLSRMEGIEHAVSLMPDAEINIYVGSAAQSAAFYTMMIDTRFKIHCLNDSRIMWHFPTSGVKTNEEIGLLKLKELTRLLSFLQQKIQDKSQRETIAKELAQNVFTGRQQKGKDYIHKALLSSEQPSDGELNSLVELLGGSIHRGEWRLSGQQLEDFGIAQAHATVPSLYHQIIEDRERYIPRIDTNWDIQSFIKIVSVVQAAREKFADAYIISDIYGRTLVGRGDSKFDYNQIPEAFDKYDSC